MWTALKNRVPSVVLAVAGIALAMAASATAATLITSAQIQDNTVASIDVKDGTLAVKDLSGAARTAIKGAACTIPGHGSGTIQLTVLSDGQIRFSCKNAYTTDNDGDEFTEAMGDCNDADAAMNPGEFEVFDGKDNDCDGTLWFDAAFYTGPPGTENVGICHGGLKNETTSGPNFYVITSPEQTPLTEVNDGADNDCDGVIDEGF